MAKDVVVARVPVALTKVKFWRVVEPEVYISPSTSSSAPVVVVADPPMTTAAAPLGYIALRLVDVAHLS